MEDWSGLVCKIITFWERIGSRDFEGGGNDGFGGFLRFNGILEKSSKTGFKDRSDRFLNCCGPVHFRPLYTTLDHFVTLASQTYLSPPIRACTPPLTHHTPSPNTNIQLALGLSSFVPFVVKGLHA